MTDLTERASGSVVRQLAAGQHGQITRRQLLALGYSRRAIEHRIARGRLVPIRTGVYTVGLAPVTRRGEWMAAVLSCGADRSAASHETAGAVLGILSDRRSEIHISVTNGGCPRGPGLVIHRCAGLEPHRTIHDDIPVTTPARTLLDLTTRISRPRLEAAVNEADARNLIDPERLRRSLEGERGRRGVAILRALLDRQTFRLTDSELERLFIPIALSIGLPPPLTQVWLDGFRVDFYWPELGLVVETDGLRYHRTPGRQERDTRRDHAHLGERTAVRFTHAQIRYEPDYVRGVLRTAVRAAAIRRQQAML